MSDTNINTRDPVDAEILQNRVDYMASILSKPYYVGSKENGDIAKNIICQYLGTLAEESFRLGFVDGKSHPNVDPFTWKITDGSSRKNL